jgi:amino acid permease
MPEEHMKRLLMIPAATLTGAGLFALPSSMGLDGALGGIQQTVLH